MDFNQAYDKLANMVSEYYGLATPVETPGFFKYNTTWDSTSPADLAGKLNLTGKLNDSNSIKGNEDNNMFNFGNFFDGMFKPVAKGYCKLAMNGKVAVKTTSGYKTFDVKTRKLTNCSNFAFDMDNAFWVVPTFSVDVGDIVLVNGKPHAVIEVGENSIKAFNYEDSTVVEVIKEHHVFMGKTYCYGKIFSPFAGMLKSDSGMNDIMKMMMFSQMFGNSPSTGSMNPMMMFMLMGNKDNPFEKMFDGMLDFGKAEPEEEN